MKPLAIDLFCGLGGWAEGFLAEGYDVIGFDIERHDYGTGGYPGWLVLQDVLTICGAQFKSLADRLRVIIASPPCTEPAYRHMPWKRAKALNAIGPPHKFIDLFNACFRIREEVSTAIGRRIPLVVENVVGAQKWVGSAGWHFGSYYLWGDIPALMPITKRAKISGQNWSRFAKTGEVSPHWRMEALKANDPDYGTRGWFGPHGGTNVGVKVSLSGREWYVKGLGQFSSRSRARARASAEIAKIPFPLAQHIARCFKDGRGQPGAAKEDK